jgi:hypothetical protein
MKQALAGHHFDASDNFFIGVEAFMGGLSADFLQTVSQELVWRRKLCHEGGEEYIQ